MEIAARRLAEALPGETIESVLTPGLNALKTFDPPLSALDGAKFTDVRRRGKLLLLEAATDAHGPLTLLMHLMSAGRLHAYDKRGSLRDKTSRVLIRLPGGPRAAAARVRHQAGGVGEAADARRARGRAVAEDARARGVARPAGDSASCSPPRGRCTRCCATSR